MASGLNKVMLIGNLGKEPESRYTPSGDQVTNFTLAVNRVGRFNEATGQRGEPETEWFAVEAWGKLAETCGTYLKKGSKVYLEGSLRTSKWQGQDGQPHSRTVVRAHQMVMLDPKPGGSAYTPRTHGDNPQQESPPDQGFEGDDPFGDIPF